MRGKVVQKMETHPPRPEVLDELTDRVNRYYPISGNCAQTSFLALQEQFELDGGSILKALTPFPGIALRGESCGAVVGCLMALGLVFGREELDDWPGYLSSLRPARRFCRQFEKVHGGTACGDVLEHHMGRRFNLADRAESTVLSPRSTLQPTVAWSVRVS